MPPPYCTAAQVLAVVDSNMSVADVTELIEEFDAFMDLTMDTAAMPVFVQRMISRTGVSVRVMLKDPSASSLGDYEMDREVALKKLNEELDWYIIAAGGGMVFKYGYADLRWTP